MRITLLIAIAFAGCGGSDSHPAPVDAEGTVVDGVIVFPDAPIPDATSATTGAIMATIQCSGSACGSMGNLRVSTDDCNMGNLSAKLLPSRTLTSGVDINTTFDSLTPGAYCVAAYLDIDGNGLDPGDIVASAGVTHATVVAGATAAAVVILDSVQQ